MAHKGAMMMYEYTLVTGDHLDDIEKRINHYSQHGWRVIAVVASTDCMPVWTLEHIKNTAQEEKVA